MNENQLRELLHRSGAEIDVGPPPSHGSMVTAARRRRGRTSVIAVAAAVVALAAGGVALEDRLFGGPSSGERGSGVATEPGEEQPPDTKGGVVVVPDLVGVHVDDAREELRSVGLRADTVHVRGSACLPERQVLTQEPAAGARVPAGTEVAVSLNGRQFLKCGLDLPPVSEDLERVATRFLEFAEAERAGVPADAPVDLYVGGRFGKTIPSSRLGDREAWEACPPDGYYAGRTCPVAAVVPLAHYPGPVAFTSRDPEHACANPADLPESLDAYRKVTLTPDEEKDCTGYFAVQLFVNDASQIVALNLVLSEP